MRAGIAIDSWKLVIFARHLSGAGLEYEKGAGPTPDTLILYVEAADAQAVEAVARAANAEAHRSRLS